MRRKPANFARIKRERQTLTRAAFLARSLDLSSGLERAAG